MNNIYKKKMLVQEKVLKQVIDAMSNNDKYISILSTKNTLYVVHYLFTNFFILKECKGKLFLESYENYREAAIEVRRNLYDTSKEYDNLKFFCENEIKADRINRIINITQLKTSQDDLNLIEKLLLYLI